MIQVNATTHTQDSLGNSGITVPTGSLLNVTPHFSDYIVDVQGVPTTKYDVSFDVALYKNMAAYDTGAILTNSVMFEYNISFTAKDVDIQALASVSAVLQLLADHIENGDANYPGVGVGNTAIVYPTV